LTEVKVTIFSKVRDLKRFGNLGEEGETEATSSYMAAFAARVWLLEVVGVLGYIGLHLLWDLILGRPISLALENL
jgi:hypothetical protein